MAVAGSAYPVFPAFPPDLQTCIVVLFSTQTN
jgi:hypothetical protein